MVPKPSFLSMWNRFYDVNKSVQDVGKLIGGKVGSNIQSNIFTNACAIRMSYALNYSGIVIPRNESKWKTSSGADNKWYIYRVNDMLKFLSDTFGPADVTSGFTGKKGIILFNVTGWSDATGHVTLYDGNICSDRCYFPQSDGEKLWVLD